MKAELLMRERRVLEAGFIEVVVWRLPQPLSGSVHSLKYRLAYVVNSESFCATTTKPAWVTTGTWVPRKCPTC